MPAIAQVHVVVVVAALLSAGEHAGSEPPAETRPAPAAGTGDLGAESAPAASLASRESQPLGQAAEPFVPIRRGERAGTDQGSMGSSLVELGRVAVALGIVIGLLYLTRVILRRAGVGGPLGGGGRPAGVLSVLARYPIARGQHLVLLKLGSRLVLLHQNRAGLTPLSEVVEPDEVAALLGRIDADGRDPTAGRFTAMLSRFSAESTAEGFRREVDGEGNEVIDLTRRARRGARARKPLGGRGSP